MKTALLKLRVTEAQKAAVERSAAAVGLSASEWSRRALEAALGQGLSTGEAVADERVPASPRAPEVVEPTAEQLAGRNRVPVAIARRWLASGEWREHWGSAS